MGVNKAQMINKMKIEEHNILDGQTWYHIKYDNTAPKTAFLFTYLPYNMDQAWTYEVGREHTANGGFTLTHKITHGENVIQEAEWVFDVKANDGSKFEMEHLHKMTMTEESPFYGMVYWYTGRYGKNVERKMTVFFDKIHKSILFVLEIKTMDKIVQTEMSPFYGLDHFYLGRYYKTGGRQRTITYEKKNRNFLLGKIFVENTITLDGEKFSQEKLDTRSTPYTMVWFSQPVRGLFPITRDITGQDEMIVSAWHTPGKELKIETNLPEVQSIKVTSAGPTKKFEFNGKEVATVDFDSSSKKASHTMHLPSGKDLTIDLAWPKMTPAASDLEF